MKKVIFCQVSTNLINKSNKSSLSDLYYNGIYKYKEADGYYKGFDFWEVPLWIAEASGALKKFNKELFIIKNVKTAIKELENKSADYILFSVLDCNKSFIYNIIKNYKGAGKFLIGGYVNFKDFKKLKNCIVLNSIKNLCNYLNVNYQYKLDYTLFKNFSTIPRLTLSEGCLNHCAFCTIAKTIKEKTLREVINQVKAFKPLKFKLIYLNDKTFGQALNYNYLKIIYPIIKKYNKNFEGFIIQTTTSQLLNKTFVNNLKSLHVFACELGIETFNNAILKDLKKPSTEKTTIKAIETLKELKIKIIGNFIIGFTQETRKTYKKTLSFINTFKNDFYILNIYNLAVYLEAELSKSIKIKSTNDLNENNLKKSFYNKKQSLNNRFFYNNIFKTGLKIIKK